MYTSRPAAFKFAAAVLALAAFAFSSERAQAFSPFTGCIGNGGGNIFGGGGNNMGGGGGGGQQQPQGIQRATGILSNPVNFKQYAQITGVGPIVGTVRIYNQFGLLAMQSQQQGGFGLGGGLQGGGFGGFGGGGFGGGGQNQLPGMGVTGQGDDPPQGVLLHVNYANMFLPNQQQINQGGGNGFGGGNNINLGGIGGKGFGGGFGGFGNGGHGL